MANLGGEHRVGRKSMSTGRFIVVLSLAAIGAVVVARALDWLGDVAAMVVLVCAAVVLAAVAWFDPR
jgi:hypothetical protein